jgi:hypothetical protein
MLSRLDAIAWLERRIEEYRTGKLGLSEVVKDFDDVGKLGHDFASVDDLEEVDLGIGGVKRLMYISSRLPDD